MSATFPTSSVSFAPAPEFTADQIVVVTGLVYEHVPPESVVEHLLMLGLLSPWFPPEVDGSENGRLCKRGRHLNIRENRYYPTGRAFSACLLCKRENDQSAARKRLKATK